MLQMWFKQDASDLLGYFRDKRGAPRVGGTCERNREKISSGR